MHSLISIQVLLTSVPSNLMLHATILQKYEYSVTIVSLYVTHHDRTSNANHTVVACLVKPSPIMFLAEQQSISLAVP